MSDSTFTLDDAIMTCKARAIARETQMEMWEGDDDTYSWVSKKYAECCQIAEWLEELKMWRDFCKDFNNVCNDKYVVFGGNIRKINCSDCILDLTDACSRGAGRAVSDEVCEDFIGGDEDV